MVIWTPTLNCQELLIHALKHDNLYSASFFCNQLTFKVCGAFHSHSKQFLIFLRNLEFYCQRQILLFSQRSSWATFFSSVNPICYSILRKMGNTAVFLMVSFLSHGRTKCKKKMHVIWTPGGPYLIPSIFLLFFPALHSSIDYCQMKKEGNIY